MAERPPRHPVRHLVLVLGDQLNRDSAAFDGFDPRQDAVWMAKASEESTYVWSSQQSIVLFSSAMHHFAQTLRDEGLPLHYRRLDDEEGVTTLAGLLRADIAALKPQRIRLVEPGEVTGLYALLLGVEPKQLHGWYLSVYVDAVEWAELPNTLGMSQYADGGVMASKPSIATGKYIERMSDHCRGCRFDPAERTGDKACPFTTLYWDFLARHQKRLASNPRMALQVKNLARIDAAERLAIAERAGGIRCGKFDSAKTSRWRSPGLLPLAGSYR